LEEGLEYGEKQGRGEVQRCIEYEGKAETVEEVIEAVCERRG